MFRFRTYLSAVSSLILVTTFALPLDAALAATPRANGQPFQDLQDQIDGLSGRMDSLDEAVLAIRELAQRVADLEAYKLRAEAKIASLEMALDAEVTERASADQEILSQLGDVQIPQTLLALADYVTVVPGIANGLSGPHVMFEGVNVHIRSGSGSTSDGGSPIGLGNLIVGYNESREVLTGDYVESILGNRAGGTCLTAVHDPYDFTTDPFPNGTAICSGQLMTRRQGSHNVIVGDYHNYNSYGALIGGMLNATDEHAVGASLVGGMANLATHPLSSIVGGSSNVASAVTSSILGGNSNRTYSSWGGSPPNPGASPPPAVDPNAPWASDIAIVGGQFNQASGAEENVIVGGLSNSLVTTNNSVIVGGNSNYIATWSCEPNCDDVVLLGGFRVTAADWVQVQPLESMAEAIAARQGGGACSDLTKFLFDNLEHVPGIGSIFGWLKSGCDIW